MTDQLTVVDPLKRPKVKVQAETTTSHTAVAHWSKATFGDPLKDDFRVFLTLVWRTLKLPDPTPLQLDIAWYIQHHGWNGEVDRLIIMAFRGAAKSWITGAYALWVLYRNPQLKVGVFSGSSRRAANFVTWCLMLIRELPELQHLLPKPHQRSSSQSFDVGPALPDQTPSLFAVGITAQVVGFRADVIVGDDVETNKNSMTPDMRQKIADGVREFDAIIKPGGQIIFLGTPQTEASIYNELAKRGYNIVIWPVRFPTRKQRRAYGGKLSPYIRHKVERDPGLIGLSTEPTRFSDDDLAARERSWGKAGFALQYMLDTSLSDVDRYPLKLRDLTVMSLDHRNGPDLVTWGNGDHLRVKEVDPLCFDGDGLYGPANECKTSTAYRQIAGFIDPSGKGADETTLTIGAELHSTVFCLYQGGWTDGYSEATLKAIARACIKYNVQVLLIEEDFGQGMFAQLLRPVLKKAWDAANKRRTKDRQGSTEVLTERAMKQQKELRILEALEPVLASHRLVFALDVLLEDVSQVAERDGTDLADRYSLMYQITRLSREKDCLTHDDRVEGLSGMVRMFMDSLGMAPDEEAASEADRRLEEWLDEIEAGQDAIGGSSRSTVALRGKLGGVSRRR